MAGPPHSAVRSGAAHSAVPIGDVVSRRAQGQSRRAEGPRAPARRVLDWREHAGSLRDVVDGCPLLDVKHGIYRN